jgi:hypothetical protein
MRNVGQQREFQRALAPVLKRVDRVLVTVGEHRTRAAVCGISRRHPVTVPVSLGLAARLAEVGAPVTIRAEHRARLSG